VAVALEYTISKKKSSRHVRHEDSEAGLVMRHSMLHTSHDFTLPGFWTFCAICKICLEFDQQGRM